MASKSLVASTRRTTRSAAIIEREIKQENKIVKPEINELSPKQQQKLIGRESVAVVAVAGECLFDLARVKVEPIEQDPQPHEDCSHEFDFPLPVNLNTVKKEHETDVPYSYVLLNDCQNRKIKLEPKQPEISEIKASNDAIVNLHMVKNEQENDVRYPYVLLNDCLNYKIKLEPNSDREISDPRTTVGLNTVKNEQKPGAVRRSKRIHVKVEYETGTVDSHSKKMLRSSVTPTPMIKYEAFDGRTKWEPPNWKEVVANIHKMRQERNAPIDIMGPHQWMDKGEDPQVSRYQTFVSLLLSSKTRDAINHEAMTRLREHGLTVDRILATDEETVGKLIAPVTFWRTKARQVIRSTALLRERHADDVPRSVAGLLALPGVGPKMAHVCMSVVWGKTTGIGVGSFVHRVAVRLGWSWASDPDRTRLVLESWLPRKLWPEINELLVGFGQQMCRARDPQCDRCLVAAKSVCPSAPLSLYFEPE